MVGLDDKATAAQPETAAVGAIWVASKTGGWKRSEGLQSRNMAPHGSRCAGCGGIADLS